MEKKEAESDSSLGRSYLTGPRLPGWIGDESNGWSEGEESDATSDLVTELPLSWLNMEGTDGVQ